MKEFLVKCAIILAVCLFFLDDVLNWPFMKDHLRRTLGSQGLRVEKIEKITTSSLSLKGIELFGNQIEFIEVSYDRVQLCANALKWIVKRHDFLQHFTIEKLQANCYGRSITLCSPFSCCATPGNLTHETIECLVDGGSILIHPGQSRFLTQKIEIYDLSLPEAKGEISGTVDLSARSFKAKFSSSTTIAALKGNWNEKLETTFKGTAKMGRLSAVPFSGKAHLQTNDIMKSPIEISGTWKAPLKELYSALNLSFKLVQGNMEFAWDLSGSPSSPVFAGKGKISEGSFELPAIGLFLKDLNATIEGKDTYWVIKDLSAKDTEKTEGTVAGSGWFDLSNKEKFEYFLGLQVRNTTILMTDNINVVATADLQLNGRNDGASLSGKGTVKKLNLIVDQSMSTKRQPVEIVFENELTQIPPPASSYPVAFDIDLKLDKPATASAENLYTEWDGKAHLGGSSLDVKLLGDLKLTHGEYRLNGKAIEIKEGKIKFAGNILKDTTLYVIAAMELRELIAEIIVRGHLDTLTLSLRSNPPLPQREILSWVLFNQGAKHITSLQGEQLNRSLSEFTKEGKKNLVSEFKDKLGIDRIDLDRRKFGDEDEVSLKVGKYLSKNLFVGVSKGINSDVNRIGFEASLNQHWKVQGEIGDNAEGQMHLKWKNDY